MSHKEGFSILLGFRGQNFAIQSTVAAPLQWIEEFSTPHWAPCPVPRIQRDIRVVIDAKQYEYLLPGINEAGVRKIGCFTMDSHFRSYPECQSDGRFCRVHLAEARAFLTVDLNDTAVTLIAQADCGSLRAALLRVVRELATLESMQQGDLFVHGAAAVFGGRAILIAGAKGSGKTTMLLNSLCQHGVKFLSNDRVLVELRDGCAYAHGMPTIMTIRPGSLDLIPLLGMPGFKYPHRHYLTLQECREGSMLVEPPKGHPASMSPRQFSQWLGVDAVSTSKIAGIVIPRRDESIEGFKIRRLDADSAIDRIIEGLFPVRWSQVVPDLFAGALGEMVVDLESLKERCRTFADTCGCYECLLGPGAYGSPNVWAGILKETSLDLGPAG